MTAPASAPSAERPAVNPQASFRRSQVYAFLAEAFLYPQQDWTQDVPLLEGMLHDLDLHDHRLHVMPTGLDELQRDHRQAFGLAGPQCYETEYGLPHEFRQSQELADLGGFYRAFGFDVGGTVRERPDHIAVELEFMHLLALKACLAADNQDHAHAEICQDAQRKFLQDHLVRWVGPFAARAAQNAATGPYLALARFAAAFVQTDAERLGVLRQASHAAQPTPFDPAPSCDGCPVYPM
jgi:DMSO reductase family type II enzyme chaperone